MKKNFTGAPPVHRCCGEIAQYLTLSATATAELSQTNTNTNTQGLPEFAIKFKCHNRSLAHRSACLNNNAGPLGMKESINFMISAIINPILVKIQIHRRHRPGIASLLAKFEFTLVHCTAIAKLFWWSNSNAQTGNGLSRVVAKKLRMDNVHSYTTAPKLFWYSKDIAHTGNSLSKVAAKNVMLGQCSHLYCHS